MLQQVVTFFKEIYGHTNVTNVYFLQRDIWSCIYIYIYIHNEKETTNVW